MNIKASLLDALVSPIQAPPSFAPEDFLGHIYTEEYDSSSPLFHLLSGGTITASLPFSFEINSMECFMLLHTKSGHGKLLVQNHVHSLAPSTLLLLDCREHFRLDVAITPWQYDVFFIAGNSLPYYYDLLPKKEPVITSISTYSEPALCLEKLLSIPHTDNIISTLRVSNLINTVVTSCITRQITTLSPSTHIATYLIDLKNQLDNAFEKSYSLNDFEKEYHVSKYHLCREFRAAFGMPPFQYLNHRRIHIAKHLLLTTDMKIHEIGSKVGIDNTNHFISLFRKFYGMTPLEYKQQMTP